MTLIALPSKRKSSKRDRRGGFTLIELLVVLVILSLIMGLVGPRVLAYLGTSRERAAKLQIDSFAQAMDLFFLDTGRYPTTSEGLSALVRKPGSVDRWSGPYLQQQDVPLDPWGNAYEYKVPGGSAPYGIVSLGGDGQRGGTGDGADISND